jgi:hypothetical protein
MGKGGSAIDARRIRKMSGAECANLDLEGLHQRYTRELMFQPQYRSSHVAESPAALRCLCVKYAASYYRLVYYEPWWRGSRTYDFKDRECLNVWWVEEADRELAESIALLEQFLALFSKMEKEKKQPESDASKLDLAPLEAGYGRWMRYITAETADEWRQWLADLYERRAILKKAAPKIRARANLLRLAAVVLFSVFMLVMLLRTREA